jgi:Transposase DDE domain
VELFNTLWRRGLHLITRIWRNMRNNLMPLADKLMLRERFVIETVVDILKCEMELEHSRHRSVMNAMVHILSCLVAYASGQQAIHLDVVLKDRGSSIAWVRYEPQARRRVLTALCSRGKAVPESSMVDSRSCPSLAISIRENRASVHQAWPRSFRRLPRPAHKRGARGICCFTLRRGASRPYDNQVLCEFTLPRRGATLCHDRHCIGALQGGDVEPRVEAGRSKCGIAEETGNIDSRAWVGNRFPGMAMSIREADQHMIWRIAACDGDDAPAAHFRNPLYFDRCCRGSVPIDEFDIARLGRAYVICCH